MVFWASRNRVGIRSTSVIVSATRQIRGQWQPQTHHLLSQIRKSPHSPNVHPSFQYSRNFWSWPSKTFSASPSTSAVAEQTAIPSPSPTSPPSPSIDPSSSVADTIDSSASVLNATVPDTLPALLHYGDLAEGGLAGWSADGVFHLLFESVQISTGMPWAYTIVTCIVIWRLALMPLKVLTLQQTGLVAGKPAPDFRTKPRDTELYDSYCRQLNRAVKSGHIVKEHGMRLKIDTLFPPDQVFNAWRIFTHSLSLTSLVGVTRLLTVPMEQLKHGGGILPDLTITTFAADPYFVLPSTFVILMLSWIRIQAREVPERSGTLIFFSQLRILSVAFAVVICHLPVGLTLSVIAYLGFGVFQAKLLQWSWLREVLGIPPLSAIAKEQKIGPILRWPMVELPLGGAKKAETTQKTTEIEKTGKM